MSAPLPTQLAVWQSDNVLGDDERQDDPQFLYALRDTRAGDRQVVWEGAGGRGIIAVVDFAHQKIHDGVRWYAWGRTTMLQNPISREDIASTPELRERFFGGNRRSLQQAVIGLPASEAAAVDRLASGLPPPRLPQRNPRVGEPVHRWLGRLGIDPEKTFELAVHSSPRLWRQIGFPEAPLMQERISAADIPDLYCPGMVGEVKTVIKADDGPAQMARYLTRLRRERPPYDRWRGVLIHGSARLSPAAKQRLDELGMPIEVWAVTRGRLRKWTAHKIYSA